MMNKSQYMLIQTSPSPMYASRPIKYSVSQHKGLKSTKNQPQGGKNQNNATQPNQDDYTVMSQASIYHKPMQYGCIQEQNASCWCNQNIRNMQLTMYDQNLSYAWTSQNNKKVNEGPQDNSVEMNSYNGLSNKKNTTENQKPEIGKDNKNEGNNAVKKQKILSKGCCDSEIIVTTSKKIHIGSIIKHKTCCNKTLITIVNDDHEPIYEIQSQICQWGRIIPECLCLGWLKCCKKITYKIINLQEAHEDFQGQIVDKTYSGGSHQYLYDSQYDWKETKKQTQKTEQKMQQKECICICGCTNKKLQVNFPKNCKFKEKILIMNAAVLLG